MIAKAKAKDKDGSPRPMWLSDRESNWWARVILAVVVLLAGSVSIGILTWSIHTIRQW